MEKEYLDKQNSFPQTFQDRFAIEWERECRRLKQYNNLADIKIVPERNSALYQMVQDGWDLDV